MKSYFVIVLKNTVTCLEVFSEAVQIRKAPSRDEKLCVSSSARYLLIAYNVQHDRGKSNHRAASKRLTWYNIRKSTDNNPVRKCRRTSMTIGKTALEKTHTFKFVVK